MLDAETHFARLVSGRRGGAGAALARGVLRLAEVPYTLAVNWRNRRFDRDSSAVKRVGVPVVSVGNLTLGGTGKTPMVKWIARWFAERNVRVAIVSRGYGATAGGKNDEALELEQSLPGVPHVQNPDRVAGARTAIDQFGCQLIVLDDGFQHRRLARDLDIVLLDASEPFRIRARLPARHAARAGRADLRAGGRRVSDAGRSARRGRPGSDSAARWRSCHRLRCGARRRMCRVNCETSIGQTQPLSALAGRRVAAFCGIGNPAAFRRTLDRTWRRTSCRGASFPIIMRMARPIRPNWRADVAASGAEMVVATHKDLVKLPVEQLGGRPLWALVDRNAASRRRRSASSGALQNVLCTSDNYIVTTIALSSCSSSRTPRAACCASCFV